MQKETFSDLLLSDSKQKLLKMKTAPNALAQGSSMTMQKMESWHQNGSVQTKFAKMALLLH